MDVLSDEQVAQQILIYDDGIKKLKEKIRNELQVRRDLKAKISEAKKREAFEIQTLERLDEYEKIVTKQFESSSKMEDSESIKDMNFIEKYEMMYQAQIKVWKQYEEKYEELPLAQKRLRSQVELLKCTIQRKLIDYKIKEITKNTIMKNKIEKRRKQLEIIGFAKSLLDLKKREKHCDALIKEIKNLELQEKELMSEVKDIERQSIERDRVVQSHKTSMQKQQPPQLDFFPTPVNWQDMNSLHYDKSDMISINSFALEQEYLNTDDEVRETSNSQKQPNGDRNYAEPSETMDVGGASQTSQMEVENADDLHDLNGTRHSTSTPRSSQENIDYQNHVNLNFQRSNANGFEENPPPMMQSIPTPMTNNGTRGVFVAKTSSNHHQAMKRANQEIPQEHMSVPNGRNSQGRAEHHQQMGAQVQGRNSPFMNGNQPLNSRNISDRPVPSPAKMSKNSHQNQQYNHQQPQQNLHHREKENRQHRQQQVQHQQRPPQQQQQQQHIQYQEQQQNQYQQLQQQHQQQQHQQQLRQQQQPYQHQYQQLNLSQVQQREQQQNLNSPRPQPERFTEDLSKLPKSNKPQIKSCETVNFPNLKDNNKLANRQMQNQPLTQRAGVSQAQQNPQNPQNLMDISNVGPTATPQMMKYSNNTSPWQQSPSLDTFISMTPQHNIVAESSSMMSAKMTAVDLNLSEYDNVSNVLDSDISELGAKLMYEFDENSVDGDMNIQNIPYSPIAHHPNAELQQTKALDQPMFNQGNSNGQSSSQEKSNTNFTLAPFGRSAGNGGGNLF